MKVFAYAIAAVLLLATPALAEDLHFTVKNATDVGMTELHVSTIGTNSWEENILEGDVASGEDVAVTIGDGKSVCHYDIQAVFDDGRKAEFRNQNLCSFEGGTYTIHE